MASRTTQTVVCFSSTFGLPDIDAPQPAGSYRVDHDEESIESVSHSRGGASHLSSTCLESVSMG
jgi:hypothetical protein